MLTAEEARKFKLPVTDDRYIEYSLFVVESAMRCGYECHVYKRNEELTLELMRILKDHGYIALELTTSIHVQC